MCAALERNERTETALLFVDNQLTMVFKYFWGKAYLRFLMPRFFNARN